MNMKHQAISAIALSVALAGCGGGGGGSTPAPTPNPVGVITETNLLDVASTAANSGVFLQLVTGAAVASGVSASAAKSTFDLKAEIRNLSTDALQVKFQGQTVTGVVASQTSACAVGGSKTLVIDDADNSQTLTAGDKITYNYNNCRSSTSTGAVVTHNGVVANTFTRLVGDPLNNAVFSDAAITMTFQGMSISFPATTAGPAMAINLNGTLSNAQTYNPASTEINSMNIPSLIISDAGGSFTYTNYSTEDSRVIATGAHTYRVQGTINDSQIGTLVLATPIPFYNTGMYPSSGKLKISDNVSAAYVTAINETQALVELDKGNDGTMDVSKVVPWGSLGA